MIGEGICNVVDMVFGVLFVVMGFGIIVLVIVEYILVFFLFG